VTTESVRVLEFASGPGDRITTSRIRLDDGGPIYTMALEWLPLLDNERGAWALSIATVNTSAVGPDVVAASLLMRNRTDALLGVSHEFRPRGALVPYSRSDHDDPRRDAWSSGRFELLYLPQGLDPAILTISS
jgi:hypothetical protein